jgi:hypothetical protein
MNVSKRLGRGLFAASLLTASLATGCAASYSRGSDVTDILTRSADIAVAARVQTDAASTSLNELVTAGEGDLRPQFQRFDTAVAQLQKLFDDSRSAADAMDAKSTAYLGSWNEELPKIQNELIRSQSSARRDQVKTSFEGVKRTGDETRTSLAPLLADLRDLRAAIMLDLTRSGLSSIRPIAEKTMIEASRVGQSLARLDAEYRALAVAVSFKGEGAPKEGVAATK